ncbi:MAG: hypothetical protein RR653_02600 [Clostridia bacterium]
MLREVSAHVDWCEMTMSMMREKQFEACERRLFAHPSAALFAEEATEAEAQALYEHSFDASPAQGGQELITLAQLRERVMARLPVEALYLSEGEIQLLEKLMINDGSLLLGDWDDIGAAEALVSRLWCSFRADGDNWTLLLPQALVEPLLNAMNTSEANMARELLFRYDATIHGLLYIAGLLHCAQPISFFLRDVMHREDLEAHQIARRYLQATFEYVTDASGDLILLHPGLADPYHLVSRRENDSIFTLEISQEMIAGGMNGILPEEINLHEAMCGALLGALRPEYELGDSAEDLRMLAKQGVSYDEMESVMTSMLAVLPTENMKNALLELYLRTPHWMGMKSTLEH